LRALRRFVAIALLTSLALPASALAQTKPNLADIPLYKKEYNVVGGLRIAGSPLKGLIDALIAGFEKYQPQAAISANYMTESEGALGMMYAGVSDIAPMGDDAKITDQMPFYNSFGYTPTEISVATGGYEARGTLFAWAIIVNAQNPIAKLSMTQLDQIFSAPRTGGWSVGTNAEHNILYTGQYAMTRAQEIRTWGQLGIGGAFANAPIQTYGYIAPGFSVSFERHVMHWSDKWNADYKSYVEDKEATDDADGRDVSVESMMSALQKDKYGIAWGALMHVDGHCVNPDGTPCKSYAGLKVLPISWTDAGPAVALTPENVENRSYPLTRDAYIYLNKAPGRPLDPRVKEFMRFVLSRQGQEIVAKSGIYYPLPESYIEKQLEKL
jgi:phosphate transport system substrate-binding protein